MKTQVTPACHLGGVLGPVLALLACATPPPGFPPEAQPISAQALQSRLAGKTFITRVANGHSWEVRTSADGRLEMRVNNESDIGRWHTEDSRLCMTFEGKFPSGCSAMRADTQRLYLQRSTGEIVVMKPQP